MQVSNANPTAADTPPAKGNVIWRGRPSIGAYTALYGVLALVAIVILVVLEVWAGDSVKSLGNLLFSSVKLSSFTIPDAVEVATVVIVLLLYLAEVIGLVVLRARNSYELRSDGLYVNMGIANLQNTFLSAMAFSDARLIRTLGMRIVGLSLIIVDANDGRHFELKMLKDGMNVQALIRSNLSHPTVRIEK